MHFERESFVIRCGAGLIFNDGLLTIQYLIMIEQDIVTRTADAFPHNVTVQFLRTENRTRATRGGP